MKPHKILFILLLLLVLTACTQPTAAPSATPLPPTRTTAPSATLTPLPTFTPTVTPSPTDTLTPSATPSPTVTQSPPAGMELIPAGSFQMGSTGHGTGQEPVHTVNLSAFYMDTYEVTNAQFAAFLNEQGNQNEGGVTWLDAADEDARIHQSGGSWSADSGYANHPVIEVTWYSAQAYCTWREARLPTEAEWEYAARGGLEGMDYPWGDTLNGSRANFCDSNCSFDDLKDSASNDGYADTAPVGSYAPNDYGLYDMTGNVWEWVADWYGHYPSGAVTDPTGPSSGDYRVLRGGSWINDALFLRVANRNYFDPDGSSYHIGFRCVAPIDAQAGVTPQP